MARLLRFLVLLVVAFSLLSAFQVRAQTGEVTVASDLELLSLGDISGGGRVTWTLTLDQADTVRRNLIQLFDANLVIPRGFTYGLQSTGATVGTVGNGEIDNPEAGAYLNYLENELEGAVRDFAGTDFRFVRITRADRIEPDLPADRSSEGLVGANWNSSGPVVIKFIFNANTRSLGHAFRQADRALADAIYGVFSFDAKWSVSVSEVYPFPMANGWRLVAPSPSLSGGPFLWHGETWATPWVDTGPYDFNASNVTYYDSPNASNLKYVDLRFASSATLSFNHTGGAAAGDVLVVQASTDRVTWANLTAVSDGDGLPPVDAVSITQVSRSEYDLSAYLGGPVYVRLNFTANGDPTIGGYGYFVRDAEIYAPSRYEGRIDLRHVDFVVGLLSFAPMDSPYVKPHVIRTPVGEIMFYNAVYDADSLPADTARYATFDALENPQVLFVLLIIFAWLIGFFHSRLYEAYRMKHPVSMRATVTPVRWLRWVDRIVIIVLILFYFFPSALIGIGLYAGGVAYMGLTVGSFITLTLLTAVYFQRRARLIPPEVEIPPGEIPAGELAPPPPPAMEEVPTRLICASCDADIEPEDAYTCACGQRYHKAHAAETGMCLNCGRPLTVELPPEEKMITVRCPSCEEIEVVAEGTDLGLLRCSSCGIILKDIPRGYNYLVIAEDPAVAYAWFNSVVRKGAPGLCISTTFPEKLKREHDLPEIELYWVSDTNPGPRTLDPKRIDFEIMRAVSNFVKEHKGAALVLDGVEYLTVENGFDRVLKFIKKVNDLSSVNDATMFVPVTPTGLGPEEMTLLRKEFDKVEEIRGEG